MESCRSFEREGKMDCNTNNKHKHVSSVGELHYCGYAV
jgi:hypothetical protein